jgi:hypothetical protein
MEGIPMKLTTGALALCFPTIAFAAVITLDEGPPTTSRAAVPANTIAGDVILCETALNAGGTDCITRFDRSDIIFINTRNYGGFPEADLYSDNTNNDPNPDFSDLTRVVVTDAQPDGRPLVNPIAVLERGINGIPYTPTSNQPGFFDGASYKFLSDSEVPEPSTFVLIGCGIVALCGFGHILRRKQPV